MKTNFRGFYPDELTPDGYVRLNEYYTEPWWKMTDRRLGEHTRENHELWVALANEIRTAISKRNNRAHNKYMDAYVRPYFFHRELIADGYKYNKQTKLFVKL